MNLRLPVLYAFVLLLGSLSAAGTARAQRAVEAALDEARPHLRAQRYEEAFTSCATVHATTPSPKLLRCMALARVGQGRIVEAERYISEALAIDSPWVNAHRAELEAVRDPLWSRLGRLDVVCDCPGARLLLDGEELGTLPLATPVVVAAGSRRLTVLAEGMLPFERDVTVDATDPEVATLLATTRVQVVLQPLPPPEPEPVVEAPPPAEPEDERVPLRRRWYVWASAGGAVAVAAIAIPLAAGGHGTNWYHGSDGRVISTLVVGGTF